MHPSHRGLHILATATLIACSSVVTAGEPVTTAGLEVEDSRPSLIQRVSHMFQTPPGPASGGIVHYGMFSPHYALWQSPDLYTDDMRCRPTRWAPRGYGWPKKISCIRMDYAPYLVKAPVATHGPALWPRVFRTPCCDCGQSGHCEVCRGAVQYAPHQ